MAWIPIAESGYIEVQLDFPPISTKYGYSMLNDNFGMYEPSSTRMK